MKIIYSALSKRVHRYDGDASKESCNVDQIQPEDRRTAEIEEDVAEWAESQKLLLCKRCL